MSQSDGFESALEGYEDVADGAAEATGALSRALAQATATMAQSAAQTQVLERGVSRGLKRAFDGLVLDGMKLSDALSTVGQSMVNAAYSAAVKPVTNHLGRQIGGAVSGMVEGLFAFEKGGSFAQGRVMPFAKGGVVSSPVTFPMRGGTGLMGEAGPEAIMPLTRGADGRLGVRAEGGGRAANVVINVSTPDVAGFQRSRGQIAAQMSRALAHGARNR